MSTGRLIMNMTLKRDLAVNGRKIRWLCGEVAEGLAIRDNGSRESMGAQLEELVLGRYTLSVLVNT